MMISNVDVGAVLLQLGIEPESNSGGWFVALCPFHADRKPSFAVNEESGNWVCFAQCGSGNLVRLVADVAGKKTREAYDWLRTFQRRTVLEDDDFWDSFMGRKEEQEEEWKPEPYDVGRFPRYLLERGFTRSTLARFRVGYSTFRNAAVFPVGKYYVLRNAPGVEPKYLIPGFSKSKLLYGLEQFEPSEDDTVVIVEGPLDCVWMHQQGFRNTVSTLGSHLSTFQSVIVKSLASEVCLMYDSDPAGFEGTYKAIAELAGVNVRVALLPLGKDPQECDPSTLADAYSNRVDSIEWLMRYNEQKHIVDGLLVA